MSKKIFKIGDFSLHIVTSLGGVMIVKLVDKLTKEVIEQRVFTSIDHDLEDYLESVGIEPARVINYLNEK
jgi:hypothetical protein